MPILFLSLSFYPRFVQKKYLNLDMLFGSFSLFTDMFLLYTIFLKSDYILEKLFLAEQVSPCKTVSTCRFHQRGKGNP